MTNTINLPESVTSSDLPTGWTLGAFDSGSRYHLIHEGDEGDYFAAIRPDLALIDEHPDGSDGADAMTREDIANRLAELAPGKS